MDGVKQRPTEANDTTQSQMVDHTLAALKRILPHRLHEILDWDFIPLRHIEDRHRDLSAKHLTALFEAYHFISQNLDLEFLSSAEIPRDSWGCTRCGFCCTYMRPGPATDSTYRKWEEAGSPLIWFFSPQGASTRNPLYRCWYFNGVRLRMCPLMFTNRKDLRTFCSIYAMGDDLRPSACSRYIPRHETCTQRPSAIEPWESC